MSAQLKTLEALEDAGEVAPPKRRRVRDRLRSVLKTGPGGADRHTHCAIFFGEDGHGFTSPGPDGHIHKLEDLEVRKVLGHTHAVGEVRCNAEHDPETGRHVQARR